MHSTYSKHAWLEFPSASLPIPSPQQNLPVRASLLYTPCRAALHVRALLLPPLSLIKPNKILMQILIAPWFSSPRVMIVLLSNDECNHLMSVSFTDATNVILWSFVLINSKCVITHTEVKMLLTPDFSYPLPQGRGEKECYGSTIYPNFYYLFNPFFLLGEGNANSGNKNNSKAKIKQKHKHDSELNIKYFIKQPKGFFCCCWLFVWEVHVLKSRNILAI